MEETWLTEYSRNRSRENNLINLPNSALLSTDLGILHCYFEVKSQSQLNTKADEDRFQISLKVKENRRFGAVRIVIIVETMMEGE